MPSADHFDLEHFVRLLQYTTSANDAEALTAIRKANTYLTDHGLSWPMIAELAASRGASARKGLDPNRVRARQQAMDAFDDAIDIAVKLKGLFAKLG